MTAIPAGYCFMLTHAKCEYAGRALPVSSAKVLRNSIEAGYT
jgi:hypothetical protein